jgi:hypothetical protein
MIRVRRTLLVGGAVAVVWAVALSRILNAVLVNYDTEHNDFETFYRSAWLLRRGGNPYLLGFGPPNLNPPFVNFIFLPFTALVAGNAYWCWLFLGAVCLALSGWLVARELSLQWTAWQWSLAIGLTLASMPIIAIVKTGQVSSVLTLPLTLIWIADRRRPSSARVMWGLGALTAWKPFLALLGLGRARRTTQFVRFALAAACVLCVDVAIEGVLVYRSWLISLSDFGRSGHFRDGSIWQAWIRACRPTPYFGNLACAEFIRPAVIVAITVLALASLYRLRTLSPDAGWLLALTASLLVSPKGWVYYGSWLIGPAVAVWQAGDRATRAALATAGGLLLIPDTAATWHQPTPWLTPLWGSLVAWIWLTCWCAAYRIGERTADICLKPGQNVVSTKPMFFTPDRVSCDQTGRRVMTKALVVVLIACATVAVAAKGRTVKLTVSGPALAHAVDVTTPAVLTANPWMNNYAEPAAVAAPAPHVPRYEVAFYEELPDGAVKKMYVVLYAYDQAARQGFVYFPGPRDAPYRLNISTIYNEELNGTWHRAVEPWGGAVAAALPR